MQKTFSDILHNNYSGSQELKEQIINYWINTDLSMDEFSSQFSLLKNKFSSFQTIFGFLQRIENKNNISEIKDFCKEELDRVKSSNSLLCKKFYEDFKNYKSIITISNSFSIEICLAYLSNKKSDINVFICESRPVLEGRILAKRLTDNYLINVQLITEAQIYEYMNKVDACIIGADKIFHNGNVLNKVGSNLLALTAKEFKKPFYVVADSSKKATVERYKIEMKDKAEIWETESNIKIENFYFEKVELKHITKIITN